MPYSRSDDEFRAQMVLLGTTALAMVAIIIIAFAFLVQEDSPATAPLIGLASMTVVLHIIILAVLGRSRLRRAWLALNRAEVVPRPLEEMADNPSTDCSICLQPLRELGKDGTLLQLPCRHAFHSPCIKDWVQAQNRCPLCRAPVESLADCQVFADLSQTSMPPATDPAFSVGCREEDNDWELEVVTV